jgi:predicted protein tyrosine phosphatase
MNKKIRIMSRNEALAHSYKVEIPKYILISINCPDERAPQFYECTNPEYIRRIDLLRLNFNDIDREFKGLEPKSKNFIGLKEFIDKYKDDNEVEEIIVHCHAGISRSSAMALAIATYLNMDDFLNTTLNDSSYKPNKLVYELALNELGINISKDKINEHMLINDRARELDIENLEIF